MNLHKNNLLKHNLPSQPTTFIGRQSELAEIGELLARSNCRLLTLCGPGGIGKTRLAIEAASQNIDLFPDGVWMVDLEPLTELEGIVPAVINALGIQLQDGGDLHQQLVDYLSTKHILLILDNFEHLLDDVSLVIDLLGLSSELKILVTSRATLKIREEWIRQISGLDVPVDETISDLENYSAVQLFLEGARRVHGDFSFEAEQSCVVQLCQAVEGLPLALELAASWLQVMPCSVIIKEIQQSLDALESPLANMPKRHRSMRMTFDQSWRLLSDEEQAVLNKLAIFRGGFFRESADYVSGSNLIILSNLVNKALLRVANDGRYHLHSLVRQYAEERLRNSTKDYMTACDRHCEYYTHFLYDRESRLWRTSSLQVHQEISTELDNIRKALDWAIDQGNITELRKAISAFTEFCYKRSLWREGYAIYGRIATLSQRTSDDSLQWHALSSQGWFAHCLSNFEQAERLYKIAYTVGNKSKWHGNVGFKDFLMLRLSEIEMRQGNLENARKYVEELVEDNSFEAIPMWILETQGRIDYLAGDNQKAKNSLQEALILARASNGVAGIVVISNHLGYVYLAQGEYWVAWQVFEESLAHGQQFDYQRGINRSLVGIGLAACYLEENDVAWSYFLQALEKANQIGNSLETLNAIVGIAQLLAKDERKEDALVLLEFVHQHPSADWEAQEKSEALLETIATDLSDGMVSQARKRAKKIELNTIVKKILEKHPIAHKDEGLKITPLQGHIQNINQFLTEPLTSRELEVLELIADGFTNQQIADQLFIALGTEKKHVTHILGKLGVDNRTQAIKRLREFLLL